MATLSGTWAFGSLGHLYPSRMLGRVAGITGRILVTVGTVILLFVAYQVWGTWFLEAHTQSTLRATLTHELPAGALKEATRLSREQPIKNPPPAATDQVAPTTAAPPTGTPVGNIIIQSIGLNQVVVEGVNTADLRKGPGHYPQTTLPGQAGNAAIAGHRTTYGHPFYNLNAVTPGTRVVITTLQGIFTYAAVSTSVVSPTDTSVVAPTADNELTLTTCNPRYSASQRLVLHAVFVSWQHFPPKLKLHAPPLKKVTTHPTRRKVERAATSLAGNGGGDWVPALWWGLGALALGIAVLQVARRTRLRWLVYVGGVLGLLVVLFYFFTAVTPLLPASF